MSNSDDPFFSSGGSDHTIIRPVPGGRRQDIERQVEFNTSSEGSEIPLHNLGKINPLESAASALLAIISRLYNSPSHNNPEQLKRKLVDEIKAFNLSAEKEGYDQQTIENARYALCTTIDEAIFNTPWGHESGWGENSLLSIFHQEVSGGDQFFHSLKDIGQNPSKNIDLLELKYVCLALGFQGRYRIVNAGKEKLFQIRNWLSELIRKQRGSKEPLLSPHWQGVETEAKGLSKTIPLWVSIAVACALLLALFLGLYSLLNSKAEPVKREIVKLDVPEVPIPPKISEIEAIRAQLPIEIGKEYVDVRPRENDGRTLIELRGDRGLFASGSDRITEQREPLIKRIATIIAAPEYNAHSIRVIGHTDNVPIRNSIRFADNFALSKARATTVKEMLQDFAPNLRNRITVQGKGDIEPLDARSTKDARAKNRRVEIILD
ncbi:type IVB secretion system protein IcmH/DotU [Cocleimonas sp. KMM 6892]|uniref:type IVB secretion system protein IcmH/DotU n=1 Tax=unclassified Cocleimonas TaxID=2639732 RepID=UPI002DBA1261|nr:MULTISPECIES: type IVB secretion system protein IcmH/DotU [unclassified Cocleimonas]MEB8434445.1 type IVB secretion system protein IcmH/DotU [Cocleimonas sp. KMM 6892]MEC4717338.1 type IVB secretion system protein IcmH/DotU [Cocleimonas sp. KMM 6895]MEC4746717.1 type IVB secretion system protein IcmH/DotU [Cocleimonas sp. KMM 6896]